MTNTITPEALHTLLLENECVITFTKVNGEQREMPCTLRSDIVPPTPVHVTNTDNPVDFPKVKKSNPDIMNVWCTDKKEWRSFRIANFISVKVKDETNPVQSQ
jgi:hypothetical protein